MSNKRNKKKKRKSSKSGKNRTPLGGHTHVGKQLKPPFSRLEGKIALSSWANERLPEMIWAALIRVLVDQEYAINEFKRVLNFIGNHPQRELMHDLTLTGISKLEAPLREELIGCIVDSQIASDALPVLRIFEALPAHDSWNKLLPDTPPNIELLMDAVGVTLWHQSQEATDCRWLRVVTQVISGKFHIPREMAEEWLGYPNVGDQCSVRPSIRASEIQTNPIDPPDMAWPNSFWDEAWKNTPCFILDTPKKTESATPAVTRQALTDAYSLLEEHWEATHTTTAIDAKHDAVFGMAFYSLRMLDEILGIGISESILGRLGLRTILETHINLRYLLSKDDIELWKKWRVYGAGQAKLNALRFDVDMDAPRHIDIKSVEQIAGEDIWEEFLTINLGSWSGLNLRKISEKAGLKPIYDQHYSWVSGYSHGSWAQVRETCYQTCGNPLHRLHRYPERNSLPDVIFDAVKLVDEVLSDLNSTYPGFNQRLYTDEEKTEHKD